MAAIHAAGRAFKLSLPTGLAQTLGKQVYGIRNFLLKTPLPLLLNGTKMKETAQIEHPPKARELLESQPMQELFDGLPPKTKEVAQLCSIGYSTNQAAVLLDKSEKTVKVQLGHALDKIKPRVLAAITEEREPPTKQTPYAEWITLWLSIQGADSHLKNFIKSGKIGLSSAEREIAAMSLTGLRRKEIGAKRAVSMKTVARQRYSISTKLRDYLASKGEVIPEEKQPSLSRLLTYAALHHPSEE